METRPETRRRSASANFGAAAVLLATLSGCSASADEEDIDYAAVCADQQTELRVDDDDCDDGGSHAWYYIPRGSRAPAHGERVSSGSFSAPTSGQTAYRGGSPTEGGTVGRGGFGGSSESVGG